MADVGYNVLALIPSESDFSIENAVIAFVLNGYSASLVTSRTGGRRGFLVMCADAWSIVAWLEGEDYVAAESQEIVDVFGPPPGVAFQSSINCPRRLSVWSSGDSALMNAHRFEAYIDFLKNKFGLYVFDQMQGLWR